MTGTVQDLKQRLQIYLSTRGELEARCATYVKEIKDLQDDHIRETRDLQNHLASVEVCTVYTYIFIYTCLYIYFYVYTHVI
jgi:hypothetical protein